ncbi:MAG: hypothetical protein ABI321_16405 [Polyangia bacterium]
MLYSATERTLTETVSIGLIRSDGSVLDEASIAALAHLKGSVLAQGPIEQVQLVFLVQSDAEAFLGACKRCDIRCCAIVEGRSEVLFEASRLEVRPKEAVEGVLLPVLREASWPHAAGVAHRPLLTGIGVVGPLVTYGWDTSTALRRLGEVDLGERTREDFEAEAIANLVRRGFVPKLIADNAVGMPGEYASETILVPSLMKECARLLDTELILVSVPKESTLLAVRADDLVMVQRVVASTREMFDAAEGRRISPIPFLVSGGEVRGIVNVDSEAAARSSTKPWYKFW